MSGLFASDAVACWALCALVFGVYGAGFLLSSLYE